MKEWKQIKDLIGIGGLAGTPQGITLKAKKENWRRRRVTGIKGNVFEYYVGDMPQSVQKALGIHSQEQSFLPQSKAQNSSLTTIEKEDELELIPYYEVYASAGTGAFNSEVYKPDDYIGLSHRWLNMRGFRINHLTFIMASGDSMHPTISDGDMLLVDMGEKTPQDGKIYVIRQGDQIWVKRVQGIINGIRLISDNKDIYSPIDVIFNDALDFEVIGRVVHIGHNLI